MDGSLSAKANLVCPEELRIDTADSKRRKIVQKTVLTVRIQENAGKQKVEGPPSDLWSWRKYGQKPIKGSPYPRGYYRCSTSKGCSAKKQVERSKTDASMLIITYTSDHNHPSPSVLSKIINPATKPLLADEPNEKEDLATPNSQEEPTRAKDSKNESSNLPSPPKCSASEDIINQQDPGTIGAEKTQDHLNIIFDEEGPLPYPYPHNMSFPTKPAEEDNFFDELGELPISSSFTSLVRSSFFDERILLPS